MTKKIYDKKYVGYAWCHYLVKKLRSICLVRTILLIRTYVFYHNTYTCLHMLVVDWSLVLTSGTY